jgi:hypothetical protein
MDDALPVHRHRCATVVGRLGSVHTVITTGAVAGFTESLTSTKARRAVHTGWQRERERNAAGSVHTSPLSSA